VWALILWLSVPDTFIDTQSSSNSDFRGYPFSCLVIVFTDYIGLYRLSLYRLGIYRLGLYRLGLYRLGLYRLGPYRLGLYRLRL